MLKEKTKNTARKNLILQIWTKLGNKDWELIQCLFPSFVQICKIKFLQYHFCHNKRKGCCICWFSTWALLWLSLSKHHFQYTQGTFCHNGKKGFPFGFFWKIGKRFTHQIREKINSQHVHFSPGGKSGFLLFCMRSVSHAKNRDKKWLLSKSL